MDKKYYLSALIVQDACNLSGVVHDFGLILTKLWEEAREKGEGTDWVNQHPISVLFADKIATLAGAFDSNRVLDCFTTCEERGGVKNEKRV